MRALGQGSRGYQPAQRQQLDRNRLRQRSSRRSISLGRGPRPPPPPRAGRCARAAGGLLKARHPDTRCGDVIFLPGKGRTRVSPNSWMKLERHLSRRRAQGRAPALAVFLTCIRIQTDEMSATLRDQRRQNPLMTNLAGTFKVEMARIGRKEMRTQIEALKKSNSTNRAEIAFLKKRAGSLEREVKLLIKALPRKSPDLLDRSEHVQRFSPKGLASHRQRLGLSAADAGLLLGTSGQSIYNWKAGTSRRRASILRRLQLFEKWVNAQLMRGWNSSGRGIRQGPSGPRLFRQEQGLIN